MCLIPRSGVQSFFSVFTQISPVGPTWNIWVNKHVWEAVVFYVGVEDLREKEALGRWGWEVLGENQLDAELAACEVRYQGASSFLWNVEHDWLLITSIRCARRPIYNCLDICQVIFVHLRRKSLIPILQKLLQPQYWSPPFSPEPKCAPSKGILWKRITVQAKFG